MDEQLAHRLEDAAAKLHRRKSGIIVHAIEEYLDNHAPDLLGEEARVQSLLASQMDLAGEGEAWGDAHDTRGWQA
jgi:hypothetical protein